MTALPRTAALVAAVLLTLLTACTAQRLIGNPQQPYPPATPPKIGDILHLRTGIYVDESQMLDAASDVRIIYVGETHDNPASHRLQLTLLKALSKRYPGQTALAMEMFTPSQQQTLDDWTSGALSEKEFLRRWYSGWKMDFGYYQDILNFARDNHIPILGINAEKSLVRAVGHKDFSELTPEEQAQLPEGLDVNDPYQKALTEAIFGGHSQGSKQFAGFQRIQTLWDETMADNIARFLASPQGEGHHVLVLAGGNHVRNGFGIPRRVFRRLPLSYVLISNDELQVDREKQKEAYMNVSVPTFPMPAYDYVVYTRYEELEKRDEVKLGVMLEEKEHRIVITALMPDSAAEKAGVQSGDIVLELDGSAMNETFDLIYAIKQKRPGDRAQLVVERNGGKTVLDIQFDNPLK